MATKVAAIKFKKTAPFKAIRSLSGKLYQKPKNIEFAQIKLGHDNVGMILKYVDGWQKEWLNV